MKRNATAKYVAPEYANDNAEIIKAEALLESAARARAEQCSQEINALLAKWDCQLSVIPTQQPNEVTIVFGVQVKPTLKSRT